MSAIGVTRNEKTVSGALALGMHLLFAVLIVFGVAWQQKRSDAPVVVDLWSNLPPLPQPKVVAPPPEAKPEPEPPKPAPRVEPKPEPKPVPKPDIALKEKEKVEKERKQKEQEQEKADARKREVEKKREEEKKKQALKDRQEREAKAKAEREQLEAMQKIQEQQTAQATARQRAMDEYRRRISDKIRRFVVLPPNLQGNPEAEFEVVQIPGGEVLSVKLKRSSGNSAYDAAVERAIYKAQPLPPPPEGFNFGEFRELSLKFRPKE